MTRRTISNIRTSFLTCAIALSALASASPASAQGTVMKVEIPFAFENGSEHLPSGLYRIDFESQHMVLLRNSDSHSAGFAMTIPEDRAVAQEKGSVIFRRYGDKYFLHEIWTPGSTTGRVFVKTHEEKQVQTALSAKAPTNVQLAGNASPR